MTRILQAIVALLALSGPAFAARVALVIGNGSYEHTVPLATPVGDAEAFAYFLTTNGFTVTKVTDASRTEMAAALQAFAASLQPDDTALFYYAGHGLQMDGANYLVGVDAKLASEFDVAAETVELSQIVAQMEKRAHVAMVFIDACRDNPLAANLRLAGTRGISVGLAPVQTTSEGTMIAFAAGPGQVAYDGAAHSPFTLALIENLGEPELEVATAFKRVIRDVRAATGDKQVPQVVSTMSVEFYFNVDKKTEPGIVLLPEPTLTVTVPAEPEPTPTAVASVPEPTATPTQPAVEAAAPLPDDVKLDLDAARRIGTIRALQLFIAKHPREHRAEVALFAAAAEAKAIKDGLSAKEAEALLNLGFPARLAIQGTLNTLGYGTGNPDGVIGAKSRRAIKDVQEKQGEAGTGYVTLRTLVGLDLELTVGAPTPISAPRAQYYDPVLLGRLESDSRLLKVVSCIKSHSLNYGFFESHLYVAVLSFGLDFKASNEEAQRCGGHLVSIASKAENEFAFSLVRADPNFIDFFEEQGDEFGGGPYIGFEQRKDAREPAWGWVWSNGDPVKFTAWAEYQPDDWEKTEDVAHYWFQVPKGRKPAPADYPPTWNDRTDDLSGGYIMEVD